MSNATSERDCFRGCLLGLAVGDAVGTTVEFQPRGSFLSLTDMTGGGPFELERASGPTTPPWPSASQPAWSSGRASIPSIR